MRPAHAGGPQDAGERYTFEQDGAALISGREGMKDEWLNDTGIILVSLTEGGYCKARE